MVRILVLAGTYEARQLCGQLTSLSNVQVRASMSGATTSPAKYPVPVRIGGFGGSAGLARELKESETSILIDATHPFAAAISRNAEEASRCAEVLLARFKRPKWVPRPSDRWFEFKSLAEAFGSLPSGSRVMAALGSKSLSGVTADVLRRRSDLKVVLRVIDRPIGSDIQGLQVVTARPPFTIAQERNFLLREGIDCLLCRNSGGDPGRSKLDAAAELGIPVYLVSRPPAPEPPGSAATFDDLEDLFNWVKSSLADLAGS